MLPRLVVITTHPIALRLFTKGQLAHFRNLGYEVICISSPGSDLDFVAQREGVKTIAVPMQRELRPFADLISLFRLWWLFRQLRPTIVNAGTPKAGLLGMVAAWLSFVPIRVYMLHGLRLETTQGLKRRILSIIEKITSACANRVICISESLRQAYLEIDCAPPSKTLVLGCGSSNGIDASRFVQTPEIQTAANALRHSWDVSNTNPVIGYVGRFTKDKGIIDLVEAFDQVLATRPDAWLLLVGNYESGDPIPTEYVQRITNHPRIICPGFVHELAPYYGAMQVLAFPTHREGFGNVALEAAVAGLPTVGYRATGVVDAVQDGVTGTLVPLGDIRQLANALIRYLDDPALRAEHSQAGQHRVTSDFRPQDIWKALHGEYTRLLQERGLTVGDACKE